MRLWHDDVRPAPTGWAWAKNNEEALVYLRARVVDEISMDHDLGADPTQGMHARGNSHDGSGYDLVLTMCDEALVPDKVTIHSWNIPGRNRMAARLRECGYAVVVEPFSV